MEELIKKSPLTVLNVKGNHIHLEHGYVIERESESLFKLTHDGAVVAPFDNVPELIDFVLADMQLNGLL